MSRVRVDGVVVPNPNHYTLLMGDNPKVRSALRSFRGSR
jgi:hypothetical protein